MKKTVVLISIMLGLSGCGKHKPFVKESDILTKSACENCKQPPFYVNGQWI